MPALEELEHQATVVEACVVSAMNRAGLVASDGLTMLVKRDTARINGDITAQEQDARISAVKPTVAQDNAGTAAEHCRVIGVQTEEEEGVDGFGGDGGTNSALDVLVEVFTLSVLEATSKQSCPVPDRRAGQAEVFMGLVDGSKIWVERALVHQAFCAQVAEVHEHRALRRGQVLARADAIDLWQDVGAEAHKAAPLASIRLLGGRTAASTEEVGGQVHQGSTCEELGTKGSVC